MRKIAFFPTLFVCCCIIFFNSCSGEKLEKISAASNSFRITFYATVNPDSLYEVLYCCDSISVGIKEKFLLEDSLKRSKEDTTLSLLEKMEQKRRNDSLPKARS